jgi:hypothetical protein
VKAIGKIGACLMLAAACSADPFVTPQSDEPYLYVALTPPGDAPGDTALYAFLLRAGTPINSPYLTATRFEVRRVADGALLDWREIQPSRPGVILAGPLVTEDGNYVLPLHGSGGRLGRIDLVPGDRYEITVDVDTLTIHGSASIPDVAQPVFESGSPTDLLRWPRVAGAGGYSVTSQDYTPTFTFTGDTVVQFDERIDNNISGTGTIVRAYDPQLYAFLVDRRAGRSGIDRGLGVFGAYTSRSIPPR